MGNKEEKAIVLDFLPYGYPLEKKMMPLAQAMGLDHFTLLELVPRRGVKLESREIVYIGEGKRDKVYYILGRLSPEKMTESCKNVLSEHLSKLIEEDEQKFLDFFNKADPINTRLHQLELLPGFGKKHTLGVLEERKKKPFTSFADVKKRISNIPDPKTAIIKRIIEEINGGERHNLFVN